MSDGSASFEALLPEAGKIRWEKLQDFPWIRALSACPQDPVHHAEGDVGIHTHMVLEALLALPAVRHLSDDDFHAVYLGCLFHDVAKPVTTRLEGGRLTAKGHSRTGDLLARRILWEMNAPFALREQVCALVRYHQIPFYLIERHDAARLAAEISLATRADLLAIVAEADIRGRICADTQRILDNIELFRETCREEDCYDHARAFASDHTRFLYFRSEDRHPDVEAYDDTTCEMVLMSGLPGAGKDTFVREHLADWPVISLDGLRDELDVDPTAPQGAVVQAAKERARALLRAHACFVWNATNLNRQRRAPLVQLAADYGARVRMVYVEVPYATLLAQNRARDRAVPRANLQRMTERWEVPAMTEAQRVELRVRQPRH